MNEPHLAVVVNGCEVRYPAPRTLAEVVADVTAATSGIAAAVNGDVSPRSRWADVVVGAGDVVDVVTAKQGG
jgi:sulfur carrier protein